MVMDMSLSSPRQSIKVNIEKDWMRSSKQRSKQDQKG